jgi:3-phosphoshikimate 1-carboxyvinyltransferase
VPASKSESNRALIIQALAGKGIINNLSTARDTITMDKLLKSNTHVLDVIDAGTTMRFLTAYLAVSGQDKTITGTKRMCERPIGILVDALRQLGARIDFTEKEGYPPLQIRGFESSGIDKLQMRGDVSSQYISAILMISPTLEKGLTLTLTGKIGSQPYINMTLGIMKHFGIDSKFEKNIIYIPRQTYRDATFNVDPDWSGASYWYSMVALAEDAGIFLKGFSLPSYQGDSKIKDIMSDLGVASEFKDNGLQLSKSSHKEKVKIDFSDIPDLAQTVAVVCSAKGIYAQMIGLESLRIKETDRIAALQHELLKLNSRLIEKKPGEWELIPARQGTFPDRLLFSTYDDHRMAMALAPLATMADLQIEDPSVVQKSYPTFWDDLARAGFQIEFQNLNGSEIGPV